ncbi:uncharacterized protein PFL1_02297 [Pseudozyma flocculosa PF-1]|uniref:Zn(2)-C6 fungal-type domain-containing protein n=1 Tax=Pseudozyma flocculosa TaxID=84751 RepID=A0A5C3F5V6_9BASI|nr:uncharacterized protein PFL1_02297 [Pseudozyma flocculosa PF-1]EPQ30181.1 hypothetical protein PFL1_02297 [Pseudozyma flocculosa PF-1]SPO39893.1 uncharacterized protein PSFLO_05374 [Pseudozyma flocculosa]
MADDQQYQHDQQPLHPQPQHDGQAATPHDEQDMHIGDADGTSDAMTGAAALERLAAATAAASAHHHHQQPDANAPDMPQPRLEDVSAVIAAAAANGAFAAAADHGAQHDVDGAHIHDQSNAMDIDEPGATQVQTEVNGGEDRGNIEQAVAIPASEEPQANADVPGTPPVASDHAAPTTKIEGQADTDGSQQQPDPQPQTQQQEQQQEQQQLDGHSLEQSQPQSQPQPQPQQQQSADGTAQPQHGDQEPRVRIASEADGTPSREATDDAGASTSADASTSTPRPKKERAKPKPRSKSATKITRFRKITSCLQCREKKQKCDRVKPVCGNCRENPGDDPCHFIDEEQRRPTSEERAASQHIAVDSPLPLKRKHVSEDTVIAGLSPSGSGLPLLKDRRHAQFLQARRQMVDKLAVAGKDRERDFNARVNAARAAAIADVLFESLIELPSAEQVSSLLYTYKTQVEPFVNVVITDINMARFQSFLRWWHSKPTTMPADPPLVPLLLVVLALALQTHRTSMSFDGKPLSNEKPVPGFECSDERTLLVSAGRCLDALQIACPSAWSSAFQAPIDLIKASLLRGIWHMNELNLQFAGTCFAITTRLAYAAGLHRDPKHWSGMRIEEAQARRNLWWNIVFFEVAHAHRLGQPPCLSHEGFDTGYPDDYDALYALYERAGLADPDPSRVILPAGHKALIPCTPTRNNFDYHWARFRIYHIFLRQSQQLFRFGISSPPDPNLIDDYTRWKELLPQHFKDHFAKREQGAVRPSDECLAKIGAPQPVKGNYDPHGYEEYESYLQGYNLEFMYHQSMITIHRPYIDEQGAWKPPGSVQKSLEVCLSSAEAIIATVSDVLAVEPPFSMFNNCAYFSFNAGLVLAIHCKLDPSSQKHRPSLRAAMVNLQLLADMARLGNIAEQAGRYCNTLKQMLQGSGGDLARLAASITDAAQDTSEIVQGGDTSGVVGALDPSLQGDDAAGPNGTDNASGDGNQPEGAGGATAAGGSDDKASHEGDGFPETFPAYLLPFVGLPPDMSNLGPQADYWSMAGSASGLPFDFALPAAGSSQSSQVPGQADSQGVPQSEATASSDHWDQQQHQQHQPVDEGAAHPATTESHPPMDEPSSSATQSQSAVAAEQTAAEQYQSLYELFASRNDDATRGTEVSHLPDRPMSFSQHYNHQAPAKSLQTQELAHSAGNGHDERLLGANLLSKFYEQTQQQSATRSTAGGGGGGGDAESSDRTDAGMTLDAVASAAESAGGTAAINVPNAEGYDKQQAEQQPQQPGDSAAPTSEAQQLDTQEHNNTIAGVWYALENFSQMLNNRQ